MNSFGERERKRKRERCRESEMIVVAFEGGFFFVVGRDCVVTVISICVLVFFVCYLLFVS